mgnify:CR=1 FL=1
MALLNLTAASRAVGVNRSTIARALKAGRLSATTNEEGERCIDTVELMRVFGTLKTAAQGDAPADAYPLHRHAIGDAQGQDALIEVLQEQLRQANEREREGREREARLLALLETEQAARRDLETKLLPAPTPPKPAPPRRVRPWLLLALLLGVVAFAGWRWWDAIRATVATLVN